MEWLVIVYGLVVEGWQVSTPAPFPVLKHPIWGIPVNLVLIIISIMYLVYSFIWAFDSNTVIKVCGALISCINILVIIQYLFQFRKSTLKMIDSAICLICIIFIAYCRMRGY